jgi:UDP-N-acetylmuramoylalanine--D-glutamate ligase
VAESTAEGDVVVLELSSFQAHAVTDFHPRVVALTNLAPDHLYWHGSFDAYAEAKMNLLRNARPEDAFILNLDDAHAARLFDKCGRPCRAITSSAKGDPAADFRFDGRTLLGPAGPIVEREELSLPGIHNVENALNACAARTHGIGLEPMRALRAWA